MTFSYLYALKFWFFWPLSIIVALRINFYVCIARLPLKGGGQDQINYFMSIMSTSIETTYTLAGDQWVILYRDPKSYPNRVVVIKFHLLFLSSFLFPSSLGTPSCRAWSRTCGTPSPPRSSRATTWSDPVSPPWAPRHLRLGPTCRCPWPCSGRRSVSPPPTSTAGPWRRTPWGGSGLCSVRRYSFSVPC